PRARGTDRACCNCNLRIGVECDGAFQLRSSTMEISSQLPNVGHETQSRHTFMGKSLCSTTRKPIFLKNAGARVRANTCERLSLRALSMRALTIAVPVPRGEISGA